MASFGNRPAAAVPLQRGRQDLDADVQPFPIAQRRGGNENQIISTASGSGQDEP